jgi:CrcB protein
MVLSIAAGGAIGSVLRHFAGVGALAFFGTAFPYGTLFVNVAGSFVMGVIVALFAHLGNPSQEMRAFLTVGLLGGFTTFSSFSLDAATLYERGQVGMAGLYIALSLILSLAAIFAGLFIVRSFVQ